MYGTDELGMSVSVVSMLGYRMVVCNIMYTVRLRLSVVYVSLTEV